MPDNLDATGYLVLQANRSRYGTLNAAGLRGVNGAKIVAFRSNRPAKLERDQIAVRVTVRVPDVVFDPISPDALIVVSEDLVKRGPIEVEAIDANEVESNG